MDRPEAALFRALAYIETHLDQQLTLEAVAEAAFYSPYHFHRIFRKLTGETFAGYVRRLRLENGAFLLRSGRPVTESALASGYWTHEAFTRAFRKAFGRPPRDFAEEGLPAGVSDRHLDRPVRVTFPGIRGWARRVLGPYQQTVPPGRPGSPWPEAAARWFGVSWDDPGVTAAERIRYDAVWVGPVAEDAREVEIEPGPYLTALHTGAFADLVQSYNYLLFMAPGRWGLRVHGLRPPFEEFLDEGIRVYVPLAR